MGHSTNALEFTAKINAAGKNLAGSKRQALNAAALAAKQSMLAAPGAPKFLRGVGKKGAKVGVRYRLYGDSKAVIRWVGPAHLVNNPTKAHDINPRRRRGGKKALRINGNVRASAHSRGTRGRHFFEHSKPAAFKAATTAHRKTTLAAVAQPFK